MNSLKLTEQMDAMSSSHRHAVWPRHSVCPARSPWRDCHLAVVPAAYIEFREWEQAFSLLADNAELLSLIKDQTSAQLSDGDDDG
jgi:hypothetical protein